MHIPYWQRVCIEVFWQTAAAQPSYLPTLTWVFNLRPQVPEADALQLELS